MQARLALVFWLSCMSWLSCSAIPPPNVTARSAVVIDRDSGKLLYAKAATVRRPMASLTKIMTCLLFLENVDADDVITIGPAADEPREGVRYVRPGDRVSVSDLVHLMMLRSANDAAAAAAEYVAGSVEQFAQQMNRRAAELGLTDTQYRNPHGLDEDGHYSSALDVAKLARVALRNPRFAQVVRRATWTLEAPRPGNAKREIENTNELLFQRGDVDGVKTGMTDEAGRCLCASATRGERAYIVVVLHSQARFDECAALLDWAFANFAQRTLIVAGRPLGIAPVQGGIDTQVPISPTTTVTVLMGVDQPLPRPLCRPAVLSAPVRAGDPAGTYYLVHDGQRYIIDAVAAESVEENLVQQITRWPFNALCAVSGLSFALFVGRVADLTQRAIAKTLRRRGEARVRPSGP